jgi:hypothetical protein
MFCYFLDSGPSSIDLFVTDKITENPDLTAVRLMTKSTALVKGDSNQQVEKAIIDQLSGPDIYPVDTNYRMVWHNWLIANRFSNDPRIRETGAMAGIYCIYRKNNEVIIRNTLEIIEKILRSFSSEIKTIDDLIRKKFQLSQSTGVTQTHYNDFIKKKSSYVITKKINTILNEKVPEYSTKYATMHLSQTEKFKIILQSMVFKKGSSDEIIDQSEKRECWKSTIEKLDQVIFNNVTNLLIKRINENDLREVYQLLKDKRIWAELPLEELNPLVQNKDVADFFFYYWLIHHQLLKKKKFLQFYISITT